MSRTRTLATAGAGLAGIYFLGSFVSDFKTPGIRNIERRHTAAGAAPDHTPAIASKLGDEHMVEGRQEGEHGAGSPAFEEAHGDQKPEPNALGRKWNRTMHGQEKGRGVNVEAPGSGA